MLEHAVVAGSFDPITNGHVWLVRRALQLARKVTVVVGVNPSKKYLFDDGERNSIVKLVLAYELLMEDFERVEVVNLEGQLLVNYAKSIGADSLIRGIRNTMDFTYESEILLINRKIQPMVETVFLVPPRDLTEVSSSTVKGLVGFEGWQESIADYVHPIVIDRLDRKNSEKNKVQEKAAAKVYAQDQLRGWADGPKIVIDYHACVSLKDDYTVVCSPSHNMLHNVLASQPSHTTFYVKGSEEQFNAVKNVLSKYRVEHLGSWRREYD